MGQSIRRDGVAPAIALGGMRWVTIAIPLVFSCLVLLGWLTHDSGLKHLWLSRVVMNPASALALLCLSTSMGLPRSSGSRRIAATLLTLCAAAIAALALSDDLFATGIRPDRTAFASQLVEPGLPPNRVAPNAALCLLLVCGGLMAARLERRGAELVAQGFAIVAISIAGFAIVGQLYDVTGLYGVGSYFPMAAHTAAAIIAIAVYIMSTTTHGPVALLVDQGAAGATMRMLIPATLGLPILIGGLALFVAQHRATPTDAVIAAMVVMNAMLLTALVTLTGYKLLAADAARRQAENSLQQLARTDYLTGLPNRRHFNEILMDRMALAQRRSRKSFAVVYMDLDGFKTVNDSLGHAAGDRLLQDVAEHLRSCVRPGDVIARYGGDEFTMLLNEVNSADDATRVAAKIVEDMPKSATSDGKTIPVGISVGLVVSEARHLTLEGLLSDADAALYRAKKNGRGQFILHTQDLSGSEKSPVQLVA
jgi:diguanylate cyclase (GGDEF)-like protein